MKTWGCFGLILGGLVGLLLVLAAVLILRITPPPPATPQSAAVAPDVTIFMSERSLSRIASEILARSRLHPGRRAGTLDSAEVRRLHRATVTILRRAIDHCGTTFSDFQDANGEMGDFQRFLAVYGHEGEPCRRCRRPVERLVQQGRSTFFCPSCQPAGGERSS